MTLSEIVKLKETANGSPKAIAKPKEPLPTLPESDNVSFNLSDEEISLRKKDMNRLMKAELGQGQAIQKEERSQGWIGNLFDDAKTMLGCDTSKKSLDDSYVNSETGKKINDLQNQVGKLSDEDFAKKYKEITGTELTNDRAKNTKPPENKPSETKPSSTESKPPEKPKEETPPMKLASNKALDKKLKDYKESQEEGVELITDAGVTVAAVAAATIAVAAAPVVLTAAGVTAAGAALGTGTALAVGAGTGAVVGAGTKVGLKYSDAETGGREYTSLKNDLVKGGLNGALSGLMPGGTTAIEKTLVEKGISKGTAEFVGARATDLSFGSLYNPASNLIDGKTTTVGGVLKDAAVGGATMTLFGSALGGITKGAGKVFSKGFSLVRGGTETAGKEALESTVGKTASTTETAVNSSTSKPTSAAEATVSNPIKKSTEPIEEAATTKLEVTQEPKGIPVTTDSSIELLPGFSKKEPLNAKEINPESLVLVHLTDYPPQNGQILSAREATGASRISNHFTLNDPVGEHHFGSWDASPCAILAPYKETVALNETGLFIEGLPNDLYTRGSVKIPEGSVIIKHNPEIEKGKYKISDYEGLSGCKLIETSENVHSTASNVIEQMGYTRCSHKTELGVFSQGIGDKGDIANTAANYWAWLDFCKTQGIKPMIHGYSPNGRAEHLIETLDQLATNNRWKVNDNNYKNIMLETISDIENYSKQGYFVSYDLGKMKDIIKTSGTPRAALRKVKNELGLAPILQRPRKSMFSPNDYECNLHLYYSHPDLYDSNMNFFMGKPTKDAIAEQASVTTGSKTTVNKPPERLSAVIPSDPVSQTPPPRIKAKPASSISTDGALAGSHVDEIHCFPCNSNESFESVFFSYQFKTGNEDPFQGASANIRYLTTDGEKEATGIVISSTSVKMHVLESETGNIKIIDSNDITNFSFKPSEKKWPGGEIKEIKEAEQLFSTNKNGVCIANILHQDENSNKLLESTLIGKPSVVELSPGYKVVQIKEGNGVIHSFDLDCVKAHMSLIDECTTNLLTSNSGTKTAPLNLVFSPGQKRMGLFNEFLNDMHDKEQFIFDNPKFYDYLTEDLAETKELLGKWYEGKTEGLVSSFNELGLPQDNIVLLADPGIASRMNEFKEFIQNNRASVAKMDTPFKLRQAFSNWLGHTKVYRGMTLTENEMNQILQNGLFAHGLNDKANARRIIMKLIDPKNRGYRLLTGNNFQDEIQSRIGGYSFGDGMIMSGSLYHDVANSVGYHSSGRAEETGVLPYLLDMEIPTINILKADGFFNTEYRFGGDLQIGNNVYNMNDSGVEVFIPFVIPRGNFTIKATEIPPVSG